MDNFRDILSGDCFKLKSYTLEGIDKFGDMLHFQIRRKNMYTTKIGGCVTLVFLLLVTLTFAFYLMKVLDKTKPIIATDNYLGETFLETDLVKERLTFFMTPYDVLDKAGGLTWNEFWESFSFQAVVFGKGAGQTNKWGKANISFIPIGFKKCKGESWVNNLSVENLDRIEIEKYAICFDAPTMKLIGGDGFDKTS
jgi:hypothetical protein